MPLRAQTPREHAKHASMLSGLYQALVEDEGVKSLARSESWEDSQKAYEKL